MMYCLKLLMSVCAEVTCTNGQYKLRWQLHDGETVIQGRSSTAPWLADKQLHGTVNVVPWPLNTELPPVATPIDAQFGPEIRLHGATIGQPTDGALPVTLVWQAQSAPPASYLSFIHVVSEATGEIVSQIDRIPVNGLRPTSGWRANEVLVDNYMLNLTADLPPGSYLVNVGLYDPDNGARPAVTVGGVPQPDNQMNVGTVELPAEAR